MNGGFGTRSHSHFEPPIEMRFVDLFMIIVTALVFVTLTLTIMLPLVGSDSGGRVAPSIETAVLPDALAGVPYHLTLAATGGSYPYRWRVLKGALPAGLRLDESRGVVAGRPERLERADVQLSLADANNDAATREFSIVVRSAGSKDEAVAPHLRVTANTLLLPEASKSRPYSFRFSAEGATPPYRWRLLTKNALPPGLSLTESGQLIGVPVRQGRWDIEVSITDARGLHTKQAGQIVVKPGRRPLWQVLVAIPVIVLLAAVFLLGAVVFWSLAFIDQPPGNVPGRKSLISYLRRR